MFVQRCVQKNFRSTVSYIDYLYFTVIDMQIPDPAQYTESCKIL